MSEKEIRPVEGIFWIVLGLIICILSWQFDLGSLVEPGPGFVAFVSGLFISGIGLAMILSRIFSKEARRSGPDATSPFQAVAWSRLTYALVLLLAYILFFDILGFVVATFLLMWSMSFDRERKNWVSSLLFSLITVIISYLIFEVWLSCQLPRGVFPWW